MDELDYESDNPGPCGCRHCASEGWFSDPDCRYGPAVGMV
jgi:hypothetical protein